MIETGREDFTILVVGQRAIKCVAVCFAKGGGNRSWIATDAGTARIVRRRPAGIQVEMISLKNTGDHYRWTPTRKSRPAGKPTQPPHLRYLPLHRNPLAQYLKLRNRRRSSSKRPVLKSLPFAERPSGRCFPAFRRRLRPAGDHRAAADSGYFASIGRLQRKTNRH